MHSSTLDVRLKTNAASPLSIALDDRVTTRGEVVVDQGSIVLNKRDFEVDSAVGSREPLDTPETIAVG